MKAENAARSRRWSGEIDSLRARCISRVVAASTGNMQISNRRRDYTVNGEAYWRAWVRGIWIDPSQQGLLGSRVHQHSTVISPP